MRLAWVRTAALCLAASCFAWGCDADHSEAAASHPRDAAAQDGAIADGAAPLDGDASQDGAVDANDGVIDEGDDASAEAGLDAAVDAQQPDLGVVGVAFQPLRVRTEDSQTVALQALTGIAFLPGDHGALVWEKSGRLKHLRIEGDDLVLLGEAQLEGVYSTQDCGLVHVAPDPDWVTSHHVFVTHCVSRKHSALARYTFDGVDYDGVSATRAEVLRLGDEGATRPWHNLGAFGFFDDEPRSMWVLAGDKVIREHSQDVESELGKVLRIIPRRGATESGYDPHPDNPFAGDPELSSGANVYAWGLRSPWRGTIDRRGRIFIGDVGEGHEEVNVASEPGRNFGWADHSGPCKDECEGVTDPVVYWGRSSDHDYVVEDEAARASTSRVAWVGAYYAGDGDDPYQDFLDDTVLFSDMCIGYVRALQLGDGDRAARDEHVGHRHGLTSAAVGPDGYLYATTFGGCTSNVDGLRGGIYRIVPREAQDAPSIPREPPAHPLLEDPLGPFPLVLSDTGLYTDEELTTPSPRAFYFEPTLPLWSNGSDKERYVVLPEGDKIDNSARDAWDFPPGTLFFKTFSFTTDVELERRVETRVIRRTATGYDYHAYKWRKDGRDADLVPLATSEPVTIQLTEEDSFTHRIPSLLDCRSCHESGDTVVIGFDELRLNGPRSGETTAQLDLLAAAGLLEVAPPEAGARDAVSHADPATREALGYLHGNCAHCHNDSPNAMSALSLEHAVALDNVIDVPTSGSGQAAGIRVVPGDAAASVLFQAFSGTRMPPIGVQRTDSDAVELLRSWINSL